MDQKLDSRDRILAAAAKRIKHYGYGKTTMAEIAADCAMSPGNIYRFFEAKIDIAEAMARQAQLEQNARLGAIARRKAAPADKRLREILVTRLRENVATLERDEKLVEVAEILKKERPLFHHEQAALERVFFAEVLRDGVEGGVFRPMDIEFTAEMIQVATLKFAFLTLADGQAGRLPLPKLERELDGLLSLVIAGLKAGDDDGTGVERAANEQ
jgi:AcrR family transcriptional regulator